MLFMSTLTIKPRTTDSPKVGKPPIRRTDAAKRDRTTASAKVQRTDAPQGNRQNSAPARAREEQKSSHDNSPSQRNHRHDGALRESQPTSVKPQTPDSRAPAPRAMQVDARRNVTTSRDKADREGAYRNPPRRGGKVRDGFVASEFDKNRSNKESFTNKAVAGQPELPRLSKVMAERGLCSRREADEWIVNGWVKVNGEIIDTLGSRIDQNAEIVISSYAHEHQAEDVTIILNKPVSYVSGQAEDGYEPAIVLVHPDNQWLDDPMLHHNNPKQFHRGMLHGLAPAGRLDIDSTGMLVLTQDGRIARHLIGEDSTVEKEYLVRVTGELSAADLKRLNFGLSLDGVQLKPAKVSWQNEDQLRFVLREGKKRQIRRMCELVGLQVVGLKRIRIGSVNLGKLPVGQWRYLRNDERF